ncbi:GNAT family N-acetyltransferase [Butyrivibrio sp. MC2013]|uniref:GNAT family N-acetyltransferase n=1 Tax=Butyrivibrio sp. MC2013 TaxID=1280686 RepID=UPI0003FBE767|nr:GNAT family N-acetyltransferase [Butyrivibrio sp. MC2013]
MLRKVVFIFHSTPLEELENMQEEIRYLNDNHLEAEIISCQRIQDIYALMAGQTPGAGPKKPLPEQFKEDLFLCDDPSDLSFLQNEGLYTCGMIKDAASGSSFKNSRYIFSDVDDLDADSLIKAWQREAGIPWTILETDRLIIRETTPEDLDSLYYIYSDPSMTRYMEGLFPNREDELRYLNDYIEKVYHFMGFGVWSLIEKSTGELIGRAGFSSRNGFDKPELGFFIGVDWQRKGYATESCSAILDYGRKVLGFDKVQALVKEGNDVSVHLLEKLGFKMQGVVSIEEDIYGGSYKNQDQVSIVPEKKGNYLLLDKNLL